MELKTKQRIALSTYFFLSGLCFASWASRIPTIKELFHFNDAVLGSILMAMPIGSTIGLPISGWLVSKFDSRTPLIYSAILFAISLTFIGLVQSPFLLILSLGLFAFCLRIVNISMNTQSLTLQAKYGKNIVGSFHGLWSSGGLVAVGFSTLMVKYDISIKIHLLIISMFTIIIALLAHKFTLRNDKSKSRNKIIFKKKPDPFILYLGLIIFLASICEGGMYDWSGIYFKDVIKEEVFTYGYLIFMFCMALSRFFSDRLIDKIGMPKAYLFSSTLVVTGITIAILFPHFWTALIGFCLAGFGTAAIFPMTFLLAGKSKKYSPGIAISIISTYSIIGMLLGPPLIGYLAHGIGLKFAFLIFVLASFSIIPLSRRFFKHNEDTP